MSRGLRSGKEFRAYGVFSGHPIVASQFDLDAALEAYEDSETPTSREYEVDLEGDLSELSDLESDDSSESLEGEEDYNLPLPSSPHPFQPNLPEDTSEEEDEPFDDSEKSQGKRAREGGEKL
ncbi:hypothetical protein EV360DRAFT_75019 [Lentinula raphanica]|nr:hypothetical protein EV360DRAFT_75019 [Lentinula raphanica]